MSRYLTLGLLVALPLMAQSQKDLIAALRQEVADLREEQRKARAAQDERLAVLADSLNKTFDLVTRINEKMAATQAANTDQLRTMLRDSAIPLRDLTQKVDGMGDQFSNLGNSLAELSAHMVKLDGKLEDLRKAAQTLPAEQQQPAGEKLFEDASRDYLGGNTELALQGLTGYLAKFKDSARATDAQFLIGEIHLAKNDFEKAVAAYDALLWNYPESSRSPNAHFMKAIALLKLERRADATQEFRIVVDKYPGSELASRAREYLKELPAPVKKRPL